MAALAQKLSTEPETGIPLGESMFKIRLAVKSKNKGKSGGTRVIIYVMTDDKEVYLLTIYDKSDFDNVDDKTLEQIVKTLKTNSAREILRGYTQFCVYAYNKRYIVPQYRLL